MTDIHNRATDTFNRATNPPAFTDRLAAPFAAKPAHVRTLWAALLFCLLPFIIFSFFSSMTGDDYMLVLYYRAHGFWGTQNIVYTHWTGRYTATFIGALFTKFGWPEQYYFLHPLLLILCSWGALFHFLSSANRFWLRRLFPRSALALASGVLLMITLYVQAEVSTGFYWFSSAVTYQPAFIFFLLLAAALIRRFRRHWREDSLIVLLILLIIGCNEIAAVFLVFSLLLLLVGHYYYRRSIPVSHLIYLGVSIVTGMVILLTSGLLSVRYSYLNPNTSVAVVIPMIFFRGASVFYYILKVPLFWIGCSLLYLVGRRAAASLPQSHPASSSYPAPALRRILVPALVAIPVLVLLTLTAILLVSKGALPDRALNNLIDLAAICLLGLAFIAGASSGVSPNVSSGISPLGSLTVSPTGSSGFLPTGSSIVSPVGSSGISPIGSPGISSLALLIVLMAGLMASDRFSEAWLSDLSGYFYHSIETGRMKKMEEARANHQKTVILSPYDEALQAEIHRVFPHGTFKTVLLLLKERPAFLFRGKDPDLIDPIQRYYYNLDSVTVKSPKM
jgi:hypothetical protein